MGMKPAVEVNLKAQMSVSAGQHLIVNEGIVMFPQAERMVMISKHASSCKLVHEQSRRYPNALQEGCLTISLEGARQSFRRFL